MKPLTQVQALNPKEFTGLTALEGQGEQPEPNLLLYVFTGQTHAAGVPPLRAFAVKGHGVQTLSADEVHAAL